MSLLEICTCQQSEDNFSLDLLLAQNQSVVTLFFVLPWTHPNIFSSWKCEAQNLRFVQHIESWRWASLSPVWDPLSRLIFRCPKVCSVDSGVRTFCSLCLASYFWFCDACMHVCTKERPSMFSFVTCWSLSTLDKPNTMSLNSRRDFFAPWTHLVRAVHVPFELVWSGQLEWYIFHWNAEVWFVSPVLGSMIKRDKELLEYWWQNCVRYCWNMESNGRKMCDRIVETQSTGGRISSQN